VQQIVKDKWQEFSKKFEGYLPYMYLDVKGLVSTGMGNLIDPISLAEPLPWKKSDGSKASKEEIDAAWNTVKGRQDLKMSGGGAQAGLTNLHLDDDGIQQLIDQKLDLNDKILSSRFPGYQSWPAYAQMAVNSMAWAMGANFKFPKFESAVNALVPDFKTAAIEGHMNADGNPGLVPRNTANAQLWENAQNVLDNNLPHDLLDLSDIIGYGGAAIEAGARAVSSAASSAATTIVKAPTSTKVIIGVALMVAGGALTAWKMIGAKS
jgi:hypothetical protein